jgi:acyl-CoA synthetase (AMP-forming)/AMP-acid ligase II
VRVDTIQAGDFLRLSAQRFPGRDCFVFDDGSSRSFAEVNRRVNQLAGALHGRGVRKGDRVALLGTDSGEYVEVDDEDVLALAFTSGTTGLPKGVLQSQRMINALTLQMSVDYEILLDEFRYTASPVFHIAGQAMIFMHIQRGFPTLILPQFEEGAVLRWMQSGRLTGVFLVPTMITRLLDDPWVLQGSYGKVRSVIYGASPMSPALLRRAMDVFKCDFINAFGAATEGGLQSSLSPADHRRAAAGAGHLLGSIGKPAFAVDLRLVDEEGKDVPPGEVGEIITRSRAVMSGYLEMPSESARALRDGWFWAGTWHGWMRTGTCTWRDAART